MTNRSNENSATTITQCGTDNHGQKDSRTGDSLPLKPPSPYKISPEIAALLGHVLRRKVTRLYGRQNRVDRAQKLPDSTQAILNQIKAGKLVATKDGLAILQRVAGKKKQAKRSRNFDGMKWKRLRYDALAAADGRCKCCGRSAKDGIVLHVDHIKPLSKHPDLAYEPANLQVLCGDCNTGKLDRDEIDWR